MMRKGTPKYEVRTYDTNAVVFGPASKTDCKVAAAGMNIKGRAHSVFVTNVKPS